MSPFLSPFPRGPEKQNVPFPRMSPFPGKPECALSLSQTENQNVPFPGGSNSPPAPTCRAGVDADLDLDNDVDLADFAIFQQNFTGSR